MFGPSRIKSRREADKKLEKTNKVAAAVKAWAKNKISNLVAHDKLDGKFERLSPELSGFELEVVGKHEKTYQQNTVSSAIRTGGKLPGKLPARSYVREKLPPRKIRKLLLYNNEMPKHSKTYKLKRATRYVNEDSNYLVYLEQAKRAGNKGANNNKREGKIDSPRNNHQRREGHEEEYENVGPKRALYEQQLRQEAHEQRSIGRVPFSAQSPSQYFPHGQPQNNVSDYHNPPSHQNHSFSDSSRGSSGSANRRDYDYRNTNPNGGSYNSPNPFNFPQNYYAPPPPNYFPPHHPGMPPTPQQMYPELQYQHRSNPPIAPNSPYNLMNSFDLNKLPRPPDFNFNPLPNALQPYPPFNPSNLIKSPPPFFFPQPPSQPLPPTSANFGFYNYDNSAFRKRPQVPLSSSMPAGYNPFVYNFQVSYPHPPLPIVPPPPPPPPKYRSGEQAHARSRHDVYGSHRDQHNHRPPPRPADQHRSGHDNGPKYPPYDLQYYRYDTEDHSNRSKNRRAAENKKPTTGIVDPHTYSYRGHPVCEWKEDDNRSKVKMQDHYHNLPASLEEAFGYGSQHRSKMFHHENGTGENLDDMYGSVLNQFDYNSNIQHVPLPPRDQNSFNCPNGSD